MSLLGVGWAHSPAKDSLLRLKKSAHWDGPLGGENRCVNTKGPKLNGYVSKTNWILNQSCLIEM